MPSTKPTHTTKGGTPKESEIQRSIAAALRAEGWLVIKLIQTNYNGIPDLICHRNGRTVYIEIKRPGIAPNALQVLRHDELRNAGMEVYVMDDVNQSSPLLAHETTNRTRVPS